MWLVLHPEKAQVTYDQLFELKGFTFLGDHHHFMYIRAESTFDVHFPIAPKLQHGTLEATVTMSRYYNITCNLIKTLVKSDCSTVTNCRN